MVGDSLGNFLPAPPASETVTSKQPMLESLPDGEDFLMRPVDAGYISYSALKDGSQDLADIAQ